MTTGSGGGSPSARVGRRRSTTQDHITDVALDLFANYGFGSVSVDDVAAASGIARRTLFRYYPSKNAIPPWGDFDAHLQHFRDLFDRVADTEAISPALRSALLAFNTFFDPPSETERHRQRMRVILETAELQAHSMTMYAGWRGRGRGFRVRTNRRQARRPGSPVGRLADARGGRLSAYEYWLANEAVSLPQAIGDAFDVVAHGLDDLDGR